MRLRALERGNDELRRLKSTLLEEAEAARTQTVQLLAADVMRAIGGREQGDPTQIAAELRGLADDVIRPLSRELMAIPPDLGPPQGMQQIPAEPAGGAGFSLGQPPAMAATGAQPGPGSAPALPEGLT